MLESLSSSLKNSLKKIKDAIFVDEKLVNEIVKDIQRSLLKADVNVKLVLELGKNIKERSLKDKRTSKDQLIRIVYEELASLLGADKAVNYKELINKKPFKIMLVGLFGSGKTTTTGKLAGYLKKRGYSVAVITTDTWRSAAYDQLEQVSKKVKVDFYGDKKLKDPVKIYKKFEKDLKKYDVVIVDTAGRDALNKELIGEVDNINKAVQPDDTLLVLSADIGQSAEKQAIAFHENLNVTGVVITKLDGTAKGGGSLIACSVTEAPVRFIGTGEKLEDIEEFKPEGFVGRLLGMGDLEALLEKTKEVVSEEEAKDLSKKFLKGDFNLVDLYEQMQAMSKMGPLTKVMEMIPGMSSMPKDMVQGQEEKVKNWKFLMQSMTKEELEDPSLMNSSRVQRIAEGSGKSTKDVRELLKQYKQSKKMMKMMKPGSSEKDIQKMMQKMQTKGFK